MYDGIIWENKDQIDKQHKQLWVAAFSVSTVGFLLGQNGFAKLL